MTDITTTDIDEIGAASFPASDPPAVWTWDVNQSPDDGTPRTEATDPALAVAPVYLRPQA